MKIQFLGTAAAEGVPALFCPCERCAQARAAGGKDIRSRSGALIDGTIKLDFPPDTNHHLLTNGLDGSAIEHVFITHSHTDHLTPSEAGYRRRPFAQRPDEPPLTFYGNEAVGKLLAPHIEDCLRFVRIRPFETVMANGYRVTALKAVHAFDEEALFYLVERGGASILYAHDTDEFTGEDMAFLAGMHIDIISLDCTNGALALDYVGHMGIEDNKRMREKLLASGAADAHTRFVCNHFSHNGVLPYAQLQALASAAFIISYDGMTLDTEEGRIS